MPGLWITGLGSQYPKHLLASEDLEVFAERFHNPKTEGHVIRRTLERWHRES